MSFASELKIMDDRFICPYCGGTLQWEKDENAEDVMDGYTPEEGAVVSFFECERCGRKAVFAEPREEAKKGQFAPYWSGDTKMTWLDMKNIVEVADSVASEFQGDLAEFGEKGYYEKVLEKWKQNVRVSRLEVKK